MSEFLRECRRVLGDENVIDSGPLLDEMRKDVSGLHRTLCGCVKPSDTQEVAKVVQLANVHRQPLYPISTGMNWGIGSRLPVVDGAVIVDLSRMNRIREFNETHGYVVVEPGVTQRQLFEHPAAQRFVLNITGGSADSSFIGNMMDRGVGSLRPRVAEMYAFEVVTGAGSILQTGFGHYPSSRVKHLYPYGIGPAFEGMFPQSGNGIVTCATMALRRRPEACAIVGVRLKSRAMLAGATDALADLVRDDVFFTAARIGNPHRSAVSLAPLIYDVASKREGLRPEHAKGLVDAIVRTEVGSHWSLLGGIAGTRQGVRQSARRLKKRLRGFGAVNVLALDAIPRIRALLSMLRFIPAVRRKAYFVEAAEPMFRMLFGQPTSLIIKSAYWPIRLPPAEGWTNPDQNEEVGLMYVCPIVPFEGAAVVELANMTEAIFAKHQMTPYITMNEINARAMECVINVSFKRNGPEREAAHRCIAEAQQAYLQAGFTPYRTHIALMSQMVDPDETFWRLAHDIKHVFDPQGILAPGRYDSSWSQACVS